jgi:hypothetical protein
VLESQISPAFTTQSSLRRALAAFGHPDHSFSLRAAVQAMPGQLDPPPAHSALTMHAVEVMDTLRMGVRFPAVSGDDPSALAGTPGRFTGCVAVAELGPFPDSEATASARVAVDDCTGWLELTAAWDAAAQSLSLSVGHASYPSGSPVVSSATWAGPGASEVLHAWIAWSSARRQAQDQARVFESSTGWIRVGGSLSRGTDQSPGSSELGWVGEVDALGLLLGTKHGAGQGAMLGCDLDLPYARHEESEPCVLLSYSMDSPAPGLQSPGVVGTDCFPRATCASVGVADAALVASDASPARLASVVSTAWQTRQAEVVIGGDGSNPGLLDLAIACGFRCPSNSSRFRIVSTDASKLVLFDGWASDTTRELAAGALLATSPGADTITAQLRIAPAAQSTDAAFSSITTCIASPSLDWACEPETAITWRVRAEPSPGRPSVATWPSTIDVQGITVSDVDSADLTAATSAGWQAA